MMDSERNTLALMADSYFLLHTSLPSDLTISMNLTFSINFLCLIHSHKLELQGFEL